MFSKQDPESLEDSDPSVKSLGDGQERVATGQGGQGNSGVFVGGGPGHTEPERAAAVANLLEFLEREDREDSDERARNRGESISTFNKDLYVVKEEVCVPESSSPGRPALPRVASDRKLYV